MKYTLKLICDDCGWQAFDLSNRGTTEEENSFILCPKCKGKNVKTVKITDSTIIQSIQKKKTALIRENYAKQKPIFPPQIKRKRLREQRIRIQEKIKLLLFPIKYRYNKLRNETASNQLHILSNLEDRGWIPQTLDEKAYYYILRGKWKNLHDLGESAVEVIVNFINNQNSLSLVECDLEELTIDFWNEIKNLEDEEFDGESFISHEGVTIGTYYSDSVPRPFDFFTLINILSEYYNHNSLAKETILMLIQECEFYFPETGGRKLLSDEMCRQLKRDLVLNEDDLLGEPLDIL